MWRVIRDGGRRLYNFIRFQGVKSPRYSVEQGLREGSALSPTLFLVIIGLFIRACKEAGYGLTVELAGVKVWVGALCFADDIALVGRDADDLQNMLSLLDKFAADYHLLPSPTKSDDVDEDRGEDEGVDAAAEERKERDGGGGGGSGSSCGASSSTTRRGLGNDRDRADSVVSEASDTSDTGSQSSSSSSTSSTSTTSSASTFSSTPSSPTSSASSPPASTSGSMPSGAGWKAAYITWRWQKRIDSWPLVRLGFRVLVN